MESYIVQIDQETPVTIPATDDEIMSYEWYSVDVDTHKLTITGVLADGTRVASDVRTYYISKKGACWATLHRTDDMHVSWYYNWGTRDSAGTDKNLEYIPMTWGNGSDIEQTVNRIAASGYSTLLGFNEPDGVDQSNVSVEAALEAWKYLSATGMRLGSPCTAIPAPYTNGEWLKTSTSFTYNWFYDFMDGIEADDSLYIDFIAVHDYDGSGDPQSFINMLKETHENWPDYPIWVTEFGVAEWANGTWTSTEETVAQVKYFMETVIAFMDSVDYVERYAWFPFDPNDTWGGASGIFDYDTGVLNELGEQYARAGLPAEYYELVYEDGDVDVPGESYIENVAKSSTVTASSQLQPAANAIDGDPGSRWESDTEDPQWICFDLGASYGITEVTIDWESAFKDDEYIYVDLGKNYRLDQVNLIWEAAYASAYTIDVSADGTNWTTVFTENAGNGETDTILLENVTGRYVRMNGITRATGYGYSLWELQVYGGIPETQEEEKGVTPSKVTGVQAVYVDGQIQITWDDNGADTYQVVRSDGKSGYTNLTYRATAEGWIDGSNFVDAQLYYDRVIGYFKDENGTLVMGEMSDAAGVVATDHAPAKVENVAAVIEDGAVALTWDKADGARYYKVARASGTTGAYYSLKYNIEDTAYRDTDKLSAGRYRYKVVGYYKDVDGSGRLLFTEMSNYKS